MPPFGVGVTLNWVATARSMSGFPLGAGEGVAWMVPAAPHRDRQEAILPGPQQQRQQEKREEKLRDIRDQVAQGKLVIRTMTAEERARFPKQEAGATRRGGRRR